MRRKLLAACLLLTPSTAESQVIRIDAGLAWPSVGLRSRTTTPGYPDPPTRTRQGTVGPVLGAAIRISPFSRGAVETGVGVVPDGYMFGPNLDVKIYRLQVPLMLVLQGSAGPGAFGGVGAAGSVIVSCSRTPNTLREGVGCEYVEVAGGYLNAHEEWDVDLVLMGGMRWLVGGRLLSARLELRRGTLEQVPADPRSIHRRLVSIVVGYGFDLGS